MKTFALLNFPVFDEASSSHCALELWLFVKTKPTHSIEIINAVFILFVFDRNIVGFPLVFDIETLSVFNLFLIETSSVFNLFLIETLSVFNLFLKESGGNGGANSLFF